MNERVKHSIRLLFINSGTARGRYLRDKKVMKMVGENVCFMPRKVPLYPKLISIGNNVMIASGVLFLTHDSIHRVLNAASENMSQELKNDFKENMGCIKIDNNVFIGANAQIMGNVHIGSNVIITSGSVVVKDIPSGSVVRGNPAKVICKFEDYYKLRMLQEISENEVRIYNEKQVESMWEKFEKEHEGC